MNNNISNQKLRLGFIKTQDLADWFGMSYGGLRRSRFKKYEELKNYCNFKGHRNGVEVLEIYVPYYIKNPKAKQIIKNTIKEIYPRGCYTQDEYIFEKMKEYFNNNKIKLNASEKDQFKYFYMSRIELWGNCNLIRPAKGEIGISKKDLVKKCIDINGNYYYLPLTQKESEIKSKRVNDIFSIPEEDRWDRIDDWAQGEISDEEAACLLNNVKSREEGQKKMQSLFKELAEEFGCLELVFGICVQDEK